MFRVRSSPKSDKTYSRGAGTSERSSLLTIILVGLIVSPIFFALLLVHDNERIDIAHAASGDVIVLWDGANIPVGWTCISCAVGDPFYQVFPRASSSYSNATGGGPETVSHTFTFSTSTAGSAAAIANGAGAAGPQVAHTHTWGNPTVATSSILPQYENLKFIRATSPTTLPNGTIGMFDVSATSSLPSNWTYYSAIDGRYLRGENATSTGGSATHSHTTGAVTSGGSTNDRADSGNGTTVAGLSHTHVISASSTATANNDPPYATVVFAQISTTSSIPAGMLAFFDATPTGYWAAYSTSGNALSGRFLEGSNAFGTTGGTATSTHDHGGSYVLLGAAQAATLSAANVAGTSYALTAHTHNVTYLVAASNSMPIYRDVIVGKYNPPPLITQVHYRWRNDDGGEGVSPWGKNTIVGQAAVSQNLSIQRGGTSPNYASMTIRSISMYLSGTGDIRLGVYTGGSLTNPASSTLLWDAGTVNPNGVAGWYTVNHPSGGVSWEQATTTWLAFKHNNGAALTVYTSTTGVGLDDFQASPGRWENGFSSSSAVAFPTNGGSGVTSTSRYAIYVNYSVTSATSTATWGASEDVPLNSLGKLIPQRLRIEVSNSGGSATSSSAFRLEYATSSGASIWTQIGAPTSTTAHWVWTDSAYLIDGEATTNGANGLTDANPSFKAGQVKDTGSQTTGISLSNTEFTELEYSIVATTTAIDNQTYYFRVTDAGNPLDTYLKYASATLLSTNLTQIHYRWREDDGGEAGGWTTSTLDTDIYSAFYNVNPSTIAVGTSTVYTSYSASGTQTLATSIDSGATWATSTIDPLSRGGKITAVNNSSTLYSVYQTGNWPLDTNLKLAKSINNGATWVTSSIADATGTGPEIAVVSSTIYVGYMISNSNKLIVARSLNDGATWTTSTVENSNVYQYALTAVDGSNTVYAAYQGSNAVNSLLIFAKSIDNGATWTTSTVESNSGSIGGYASIAAYGSSVYISYQCNVCGFTMKFAKSTNGGATWALSTVISGAQGGAGYTKITTFSTSTIYISALCNGPSCPAGGDGWADLRLAVSTNSGTSWTVSTIDQPSRVKDGYSSIATQSPNSVFISYECNTLCAGGKTNTLMFARYLPASFAAAEDTSLTNLVKQVPKRLRIEVSNQGGAATSSASFRLQYSTNTALGWTQVGSATSTTAHWVMANSAYFSDGASTTDNAGLTNAQATFIPGQAKDVGIQVAPITLSNGQFTELEYAIAATTTAINGQTYYFRVTNAGTAIDTYTIYASASIGGANLTQIHYRWRNNDAGDGAGAMIYVVTSSVFWVEDLNSIKLDSAAGYLYAGGWKQIGGPVDQEWYIEKRNISDGSLVWTATSNPTTGGDQIQSIDIDTSYIYAVGYASGSQRGRIEKRNLSNGTLVYATESNPTANNDILYSIGIDSNYMYLAGYDAPTSTDEEWRIEKRNLSDGSLVFATTSNPTTANDEASGITIDTTGGYLYAIGYASGGLRWHIEKRNLSNGSLVYATASNPSAGNDTGRTIVLDTAAGYFWAGGYDSTPGNNESRIEKRNISDGALVFSTSDNPTSLDDRVRSLAIDTAAGAIYAAGWDNYGSDAWIHIEKRNTSDGSLVWTATSSIYVGQDYIQTIALDTAAGNLYAGGVGNAAEWRIEKRYMSAASFAAAEDTSISVAKQTPKRLRFEVSNQGSLAAPSSAFRLEYATSQGASTWTQVGAASSSWWWSDSSYLTDGAATTNVTPGLTDAQATFVAGQVKDIGSQTTGITLGLGQFTELEYSIVATSTAISGQTYYFRLTNAGTALDTYSIYVSATVSGSNLTQTHYRWRNDDGREDAVSWGHPTIGVTSFTPLTSSRFMPGTSPNIANATITAISAYLTGTGNVRLGVYTGGALTDPSSSVLLWDAGTVTTNGAGWYTITHPTGGVSWGQSTSTWLAFKGNSGSVSISYDSNTGDDFSSGSLGNGFNTSPSVAYPTNGGNGATSTTHFLIYVSYITPSTSTASFAAAEDTSLTGLAKSTLKRLRFEISNEGTANSSAAQYRLEYATSTGGPWTQVGSGASPHWSMSDSSYLTDGASTTDVSGGLTNDNTTFDAGQVRDTGSQTAGITLSSTEFTELEYSIVANSAAIDGTTYYFRVTNAGTPIDTYTIFASVTLSGSAPTSPNLTQTRYRWRNDNGGELDVALGGATFAANEDTSLTNLAKSTTKRLRIEVSNEGTGDATSSSAFRLEYATATGNAWLPVGTTSASQAHWVMRDSANFTDGASTTDVAGGLTNDNTTFNAGQIKDTGNQTNGILLTTTQFTELEYAIAATTTAINGQTYYFRVTNAGTAIDTYSIYASASVAAAAGGGAANLTQIAYRWRNDDGSESAASWAATENTSISGVFKLQTRRLRLEVSNEGSSTAASSTFQLEYATSSGASVWTQVANGADWNTINSSNFNDGDPTTDVASGLTNQNTAFVAGQIKDANNLTGQITLSSSSFTEVEYAIRPTWQALSGQAYYFRVSNAGTALDTYSTYASATTAAVTHRASGTLVSLIIDTTRTNGVAPNSIRWEGAQPANTSVRFQFAASNATSGPWSYIAWNPQTNVCDVNSYYDPGAPAIFTPIKALCHNNRRYIRYKIFLDTTDPSVTPQVDRVVLNYAR